MHADRYTIKAMVLTAGLSAAAFAQYANTNSPLAINLGGIAEWGTEIAFFDMFRMFRGWENHGAADGITPMEQLDEYGWPTYVNAGQELTMGWGNCPIGNKYPSGRYLLTWEGEGTFSARNGCSFVETDLANRRIVISVDSTVAWWGIRLNTTNPSNYAKNMRCYLPGFWDEATYRLKPQYTDDIPWHPNYLDNLRRFKAFRFMDLLGTNGSPVIEWEDFKPSTYYNQGGANLSRLSSLTRARLTNLGLTTRLFAASDVCGIGLDWPQCQQNPDIHAYAVHNECPGWDAAAAYAQAGNKRAWMTEHDCAAQDKLIAPTDYLKPAAYADTTGWAHPRVIDAYDPGAGPGSFIFPGDFWFRTTFTSQQSGTVRPAGKLTERDRVVSVKLFTLQGREITGELRMVCRRASSCGARCMRAAGRNRRGSCAHRRLRGDGRVSAGL